VRYALAAIAGIVAAVVGWLVTGAIAGWLAGLAGMSDFEGGRGMFAFFAVGPIGGLVAMLATIWWVLRRGRTRERAGATFGRLTGVLVGIAALVAAGIGLRIATIDTYTNELPPQLEFEIRLPASWTLEPRDAVKVELHTDKNMADGTFFSPWPRADGDRQILPGAVDLAFKTSGRLVVLELPGQPTRLFRLPLSRNPSSTPALGQWQAPSFVHRDGAEQTEAAPKDDPVALRYRVRRAGED
jgi:hypothetical protein